MIGATFELFMLSFFVALVCGAGSSFTLVRDREREEVGESSGITSDEFIAFEDDRGDV